MKLVTAIIRETQLDAVRTALIDSGISRITVGRVSGHGRQVKEEIYRGRKVIPNLIPKIKVEIAVNDEFVDVTVDTIIKAAQTRVEDSEEGIGDGKIWITNIEEVIRIRTKEKGSSAI
jgi:nitrogen regulatory protein PII